METQTPAPAAMPAKIFWFRKELVGSPYYVGGTPAPFIGYEGNRGLLGLEDTPANAPMIEALRQASKEARGGVVAISAEEAEEFKKKVALQTQSVRRSSRSDELRLLTAPPRPKVPATAAEAVPDAAGNSAAPVTTVQRITAPPPEAGFIIPPPATPNGEPAATAPPRHKPETRRVVTPAPA